MTSSAGLLLLDVDGPLNPWAAKPERRPQGYETHRLRPRGWETAQKPLRVWLNPGHGRMLLDLAEVTGWELVWATTWEHEANTLIGPLVGLAELPVIEFRRKFSGDLVGGKFPAVLEYAAGRPLAWCDDDFGCQGVEDLAWSKTEFERERDGVPTLLRQVHPGVGLTGDDLVAVREWCATIVDTDRQPM